MMTLPRGISEEVRRTAHTVMVSWLEELSEEGLHMRKELP